MSGFLLIIFLTVFGVTALMIGFGLKYEEAQKKKKVTDMLETKAGGIGSQSKVLLEPEKQSDVATKILEYFNFAKKLETHIQQAGLTWSLNSFLLGSMVLTIFGALIGGKLRFLLSPGLSALALALLFGSLPHLYVKRTRSKRLAEFEEQFPESLDFLARVMRAGHAFSIALEMLSDESPEPTKIEMRKAFNEQNLGLPIDTALQNLCARVPLLDVKFFVSAVLLQKETGGNLSEILTRLAYIIRERFKLKGQVKAASAHGRITGSILTIMPVVLAIGLMLVAPGYMQGMFNDPDGKYLIIGSACGIVIGHLCIQKIVKIKV
jgi:tight adherence protein B